MQDTHSVAQYVVAFNRRYGEEVGVADMRDDNDSIAAVLREFANAPNNLQMAIAQASLQLI